MLGSLEESEVFIDYWADYCVQNKQTGKYSVKLAGFSSLMSRELLPV
jgi:hypothetical protein